MIKPEDEQHLDQAITRVAAALADDFDVGDIQVLIGEAVEVAETFGDLDGTEKKALAIAFMDRLIDDFFAQATPAIEQLVRDLDLPGPAVLEAAVLDPILIGLAPRLLKPALKAMLPGLVDLVIRATRGKLAVNKEAPSA